ncbi:60S acidic ribosomal protein P2 [Plasmodium gonderi]|uniref:60S acidic ribosomal protein P2 n=1 Tax=Plasmodium gonderi TaxID=77519 RepID=A0A1Y1JHB0_PLAGO|nr:60S acidic ribosomal protein P2 [Plasmodium gonderi]GAW80725.1 60S acidic ribosomal protein P2 [Plasmodium gonderi]
MAMKYVAAYLMCVLGGNENPTEKEVKKVLGAVNAGVEDDVLAHLMKSLSGKSCHELISGGLEKLQNIGGGAAAAAAIPAGATTDAKAEEKKEEKKEEEEEEEDDLGFSLFG